MGCFLPAASSAARPARCPSPTRRPNDGDHTDSCTLKLCLCEHEEHTGDATRAGDSHPYLGAPAGARRARQVGPVCDDCADGHLRHFLIRKATA